MAEDIPILAYPIFVFKKFPVGAVTEPSAVIEPTISMHP
jgi:hypothetical protein